MEQSSKQTSRRILSWLIFTPLPVVPEAVFPASYLSKPDLICSQAKHPLKLP
jgi:hypothetical protein